MNTELCNRPKFEIRTQLEEEKELKLLERAAYWIEYIEDYKRAAANLTDAHPEKVHQRIYRELSRAKASLRRVLKGLPE